MAEQQLRARQMVLQQQAASAVAAASKTQREVGSSSPALTSHLILHCLVDVSHAMAPGPLFRLLQAQTHRVHCARRCFCSCPSLADANSPLLSCLATATRTLPPLTCSTHPTAAATAGASDAHENAACACHVASCLPDCIVT